MLWIEVEGNMVAGLLGQPLKRKLTLEDWVPLQSLAPYCPMSMDSHMAPVQEFHFGPLIPFFPANENSAVLCCQFWFNDPYSHQNAFWLTALHFSHEEASLWMIDPLRNEWNSTSLQESNITPNFGILLILKVFPTAVHPSKVPNTINSTEFTSSGASLIPVLDTDQTSPSCERQLPNIGLEFHQRHSISAKAFRWMANKNVDTGF